MNGNAHPAVAEAAAREKQIELPETLRVHCPLVAHKLRVVIDHCPGCQHFRGLQDRFPGSKVDLAKRFSVGCAAEPVQRQIFEIEV